MSLARSLCAVILLPGSILMAGGCDDRAYIDTTEALSLGTMHFAMGPTILTEPTGCAALALPQDHSSHRALVVGGYDGVSYLATIKVLTTAD